MESTKLSSKGQVIIPKPMRLAHRWETGQELVVIDTGDGILLKPRAPFRETVIGDVAACLPHHGPAKSLAEMEQAIQQGVREQSRDRD